MASLEFAVNVHLCYWVFELIMASESLQVPVLQIVQFLALVLSIWHTVVRRKIFFVAQRHHSPSFLSLTQPPEQFRRVFFFQVANQSSEKLALGVYVVREDRVFLCGECQFPALVGKAHHWSPVLECTAYTCLDSHHAPPFLNLSFITARPLSSVGTGNGMVSSRSPLTT